MREKIMYIIFEWFIKTTVHGMIYGGFSGGREIYAIFGPKYATPSVH